MICASLVRCLCIIILLYCLFVVDKHISVAETVLESHGKRKDEEVYMAKTNSRVDSLEKEFRKLKDDVYEAIKTQPVGTFRARLTSLDDKHLKTALNEIVSNKQTIEDILVELSFYMNFLNYELLRHVLDEIKVDVPQEVEELLQEKMRTYTVRITDFFKSTLVCDLVELWPALADSPPKSDLRQLIVKCNKPWDSCTLHDLEQIKDGLARKLLIPKYLLLLQSVHKGSISVVFTFNVSLVAQLQSEIQNTEVICFADMEIASITVDGVVCYESGPVYLTPEQIMSEMESLEERFETLKDDVFESVKTQPVDTFKVRLTSFTIRDKVHHMEYVKEMINKKDTVTDIWVELNDYLNFLNYELLQHILKKFKNADLQKRMDAYRVKIKSFFSQTRICDFTECWPILQCEPPVEELRTFIQIKSCKKWETCTLEDLDNLKERLATKLLLPKFILILEKASSGSLAVTFSIPPSRYLVAQLQCHIENTELKVFADMDIETITVDGVVCYEAPLLQYTTQLKQLYTSRSPLQPLTDSKPKTLLQFRLARIEKRTLSQGDMDGFTRESLRGGMDDVVFKKAAMEVSELGVMADGSQPNVVVIEGAPGVGKTTFAWDQCRQWAEGKLLQAYSIVLLLPLRDNNIRQITSLPSLFRHSQRQVREEVSRRVAESEGKGCLIWLEAWDELGNDLKSKSLFTELIRGTQLPAATIYITSRPWATRGLLEQIRDRISQHTELLALAKEELENEIRRIIHAIHSMTESESGFDFKTYIESNPLMHAAMHTPVSAAIVEQVFKSAPHNPPTTVTGLYSAYVLVKLEQYLTQHPKYSGMKMKVKTLSDLPERVLADFQRLCGLAYEGVSQQMIVFSSLPEAVSTLGLLQSVPQVYEEGVSYNFLHYTVQEYLAALHLSHLQPQKQMTIIDNKCLSLVKRTYGRNYYEATQFKTTFKFLAGITKLADYPVDFLSDLLKKDEATLYSWLYESQNLQILSSVLGSGERTLSLAYSATATDYFVAGYCLAQINCTWSVSLESADDVAVEYFGKGCNHQLPETGIFSHQLVSVFSRGSITADGVRHILNIPNSFLNHIKHLNLSHNKLDRRACAMLAKGVQRMPCLETLNLWDNSRIGCGGAVQLVSSLLSSKLRELDIRETGIGDPDFEYLARYIGSTTSLQVLVIGGNDISVESIGLLFKALSAKSSMRKLDMRGCHLTISHCACLGKLLRHCKVEELDLSCCSLTSDGVREVVNGLSDDNHTLRVLWLSGNQIESEGAIATATMLKINSSLELLALAGCSIGSSGGVELGRALERNKTLKELRLSGNALGDDGVRGMSQGLETNSSLEELWLWGDKTLGEERVSLLLKCVEENNMTLKRLWLSKKYKRKVKVSSMLQSRCEVKWW